MDARRGIARRIGSSAALKTCSRERRSPRPPSSRRAMPSIVLARFLNGMSATYTVFAAFGSVAVWRLWNCGLRRATRSAPGMGRSPARRPRARRTPRPPRWRSGRVSGRRARTRSGCRPSSTERPRAPARARRGRAPGAGRRPSCPARSGSPRLRHGGGQVADSSSSPPQPARRADASRTAAITRRLTGQRRVRDGPAVGGLPWERSNRVPRHGPGSADHRGLERNRSRNRASSRRGGIRPDALRRRPEARGSRRGACAARASTSTRWPAT